MYVHVIGVSLSEPHTTQTSDLSIICLYVHVLLVPQLQSTALRIMYDIPNREYRIAGYFGRETVFDLLIEE